MLPVAYEVLINSACFRSRARRHVLLVFCPGAQSRQRRKAATAMGEGLPTGLEEGRGGKKTAPDRYHHRLVRLVQEDGPGELFRFGGAEGIAFVCPHPVESRGFGSE